MVENFVQATVLLAVYPMAQGRLLDGDHPSLAETARKLGLALGDPERRVPLPSALLRLIGYNGEGGAS
ncbi:hypothetical protein [Burkholderia sp. S171]|uniref:hypothetical protein n=1 Tax=Burkholderia sp. S171 TaxID=1641860 RepID=UPI00131DBA57|nr:hypothetical protein [Burkholderia sp. S171]